MSGFERHLRDGVVSHFAAIAVLTVPYLGGIVDPRWIAIAVLAFPATVLGALFPDIDHPSSYPYRLAERYLPGTVGMTAALLAAQHLPRTPWLTTGRYLSIDPAYLVGMTVATVGWVTWAVTRWAIPELRPSHRTLTHHPAAGVITSLCLVAVLNLQLRPTAIPSPVTVEYSLLVGLLFLVGFTTHLTADGLISTYQESLLRRLPTGGSRDDTEESEG